MIKINKKVEYALMALKHLSVQNSLKNEQAAHVCKDGLHALTSAREICDQYGTPFDTVAKVMQVMNAHDILKSVKGIKGGYYLNKNLSEITYMQLVRMIEGKEDLGRVCQSQKGMCELFHKCNIVTPVEQLNRKLNSYLETLTIQELLMGTEFNHEHKTINNENILASDIKSEAQ